MANAKGYFPQPSMESMVSVEAALPSVLAWGDIEAVLSRGVESATHALAQASDTREIGMAQGRLQAFLAMKNMRQQILMMKGGNE